MKKLTRNIIIILGFIIAGLAIWHFVGHKHAMHSSGNSYNLPMAEFGPISTFSLTNQNNQPFGLTDLEGKVWVANFIFTRCTGPCPIMSSHMAELIKEFPTNDNLNFISFSVDPEYDTPRVLNAYSKRYERDPVRWQFLTGDSKKVHTLVLEGFRLALQENIDPQIPIGEKINHSLHFVLVDANGQIRGYYNGYDTDARHRLRRNIKTLLKEYESNSSSHT